MESCIISIDNSWRNFFLGTTVLLHEGVAITNTLILLFIYLLQMY